MKFLMSLKELLADYTNLPVIIDPSPTYTLQEIRLRPNAFKINKQEYKSFSDKLVVLYIVSLPVIIDLNIRGTNNEDSLLFTAMRYSILLQHFLKTHDKLPFITETFKDFKIYSEAVIKPVNIEGNLEAVLFTDGEDVDAKKFPGFHDRFEVELVFKLQQEFQSQKPNKIEKV